MTNVVVTPLELIHILKYKETIMLKFIEWGVDTCVKTWMIVLKDVEIPLYNTK